MGGSGRPPYPPTLVTSRRSPAARSAITRATLSGRIRPARSARATPVFHASGVSTCPGHTAHTRTPVPDSSSASASVNPITPNFVAQYVT